MAENTTRTLSLIVEMNLVVACLTEEIHTKSRRTRYTQTTPANKHTQKYEEKITNEQTTLIRALLVRLKPGKNASGQQAYTRKAASIIFIDKETEAKEYPGTHAIEYELTTVILDRSTTTTFPY